MIDLARIYVGLLVLSDSTSTIDSLTHTAEFAAAFENDSVWECELTVELTAVIAWAMIVNMIIVKVITVRDLSAFVLKQLNNDTPQNIFQLLHVLGLLITSREG